MNHEGHEVHEGRMQTAFLHALVLFVVVAFLGRKNTVVNGVGSGSFLIGHSTFKFFSLMHFN